jgi:hypothetical protein
MKRSFIAAIFAFVVAITATAQAKIPPTDADIRQQIIQDSVAQYQATGHPCACPYNSARNGSNCGKRSAYSRPGGASHICYPSDVSDQMVADWRQQHASQ